MGLQGILILLQDVSSPMCFNKVFNPYWRQAGGSNWSFNWFKENLNASKPSN